MKTVFLCVAGVVSVLSCSGVSAETIVRKTGSAPDSPWRYEERKTSTTGVSRAPTSDSKRGAVYGGTSPVVNVKTFGGSTSRTGARREHRYRKTEKYPDGRVKSECGMLEVREGTVLQLGPMADGTYTEFSKNGRILKRGHYSRGLSDGTWTEYGEDGAKRWEGAFEAGVRAGIWTEWYDGKQKLRSGKHSRNLKEGVWTEWHSNGLQANEGAYLGGQRHGMWTFWGAAGNFLGETTYSRGHVLAQSTGTRRATASNTGKSPSPSTSESASDALTPDFWRRRLKDQRVEFRVQAATELGNLRSCAPEVGRVLGEALFDTSDDVRKAAARSLERLGAGAATCVPAVSRLLASPSSPLPQGLSRILRSCSEVAGGASAAVVDAVVAGRLAADQDAAEFLLAVGPRAIQCLLVRLSPDDPMTAQRLIELASHLGPVGDRVAPTLARLLRCKNDGVRWRSAVALGNLGASANVVAPQLTVALDDSSSLVRAAAAKALGLIGILPDSSVAGLERTLLDPSQQVRLAAAESLGRAKAMRVK